MLNVNFYVKYIIYKYHTYKSVQYLPQRKQLFPLRNYPTYAIITLGGFPITALHYKGA